MKVEEGKKNAPSGASAQQGAFFVDWRRDSFVLGFFFKMGFCLHALQSEGASP